ncbi:MAG: hypothetical protein LBB40_01190 [Holophagales bacterium]|jgi:hypothetical protein|nr:hypothetical protein [Holophagales bacterium]
MRSQLKFFLTASLVIPPSSALFSQAAFVDVFPDKTYVCERWDRDVYEIAPDLSVTKVSNLIPENLDFRLRPRPKIRYGKIWISDNIKAKIWRRSLEPDTDGEKWQTVKFPEESGRFDDFEIISDVEGIIWPKSLEANTDTGAKWQTVKLPEGLGSFNDFEIISDDEALICGAGWYPTDENTKVPRRFDYHFIFNYNTGVVTKSIEAFDPAIFNMPENKIFYYKRKTMDSYLCRYNSNVLIVGCGSGSVTILDTDTGKLRKIQVVPEDEVPNDPDKTSYLKSQTIHWVCPLAGDKVIICYRMWVVPNNGSEPLGVPCFRTMDLRSGKVTFHGSEYRGKNAEQDLPFFEEEGQLTYVRDFIKERGKGTTFAEKQRAITLPNPDEPAEDLGGKFNLKDDKK